MKKVANKVKLYKLKTTVSEVSEPVVTMQSINKLPAALADFSFRKFKSIADKVPFTQTEWAKILHLSERTLQRYAKDNKSLEGIYVDRILQIDKLISKGLDTFTDAVTFYNWLKRPKSVLGNQLSFESLYHTQGISDLHNQLERIQHGVYT
jgi:putative toxin-antitoxin system antitoxin component (TIGR02293 family)